jgi:CelD/BcsL family acetyltransferase involved in cellulose biosynthesis/glycosyltransferase involved in cell wall biosynthesis
MLTVVSAAYPMAAVGPDAVGGAEQVLCTLDAAIVEAGHRSIVIAPEGSICRGELRATPPAEGPFDRRAIHERHEAYRDQLRGAIRDDHPDLLHLHGVDVASYLPDTDVPTLVTLHLWPDAYPREMFAARRRNLFIQCVSEAQWRACPCDPPPLLIRNGVDLDAWGSHAPKGDFVLALGRICPEKGFHLAIDAARAAGMSIILAGAVHPYEAHQRYFDECIAPRLGEHVRFVGAPPRFALRQLIASARCVVLPSTIPETSSLVAMEALASDTPVVALRSPALEELIDDGVTGWLADSPAAMSRALERTASIAAGACRSAAERRCSGQRMTGAYLRCYEEISGGRRQRARSACGSRDALAVDVATTIDQVHAIGKEWNALADECAWATPFSRPAWMVPWVRHLADGEPHVVVVRRHGRLIGVAPLVTAESQGRTVMQFAGTGISDYLALLAAPEHRVQVAARVLRHLQQQPQWDVVDLQQLRADDPLLIVDDPAGLHSTVCGGEPCPVLRLAGRSPRGSAVPRHMAANLRYYQRKAERLGAVRLETADAGSVPRLAEVLLQLHAARWSSRGMNGVLADPRVQAFHREAIPLLHAAGLLAMHALSIDGRMAAVAHVLTTPDRMYYYIGGFDPAFTAVSPGTQVLAAAIDAGSRAGVREFDFLRGREPYKYRWGAADCATWRRRLVRD